MVLCEICRMISLGLCELHTENNCRAPSHLCAEGAERSGAEELPPRSTSVRSQQLFPCLSYSAPLRAAVPLLCTATLGLLRYA